MSENTGPETPFSGLTPDAILDALDSIGLSGDGRLLALNSYENRVYQVWMPDGPPVIAKFYRPARWTDAAILEEHAFVSDLASHEIPVVAPIYLSGQSLFEYQGYRFSIFPKHGGRAPELDRPGTLEWIGRFIGRIHAVAGTGTFIQRPSIDIESFGVEPSEYLLKHFIPDDLKAAYEAIIKQALHAIRYCYERAGKVASLRLHGDCHLGNILWTDDGPHFVDFDDSRMGPAVQDLWMLLSGTRDEMAGQFGDVLAGYEDFQEFDLRELYLVEALRTLRMIHYSAWIARRWNDPAFPAAFTWFNTQQYWQERILELREQVSLMDEPPLMSGYL
jgi:Ser/Thr protein kinase RdoA (MazF antagonist)